MSPNAPKENPSGTFDIPANLGEELKQAKTPQERYDAAVKLQYKMVKEGIGDKPNVLRRIFSSKITKAVAVIGASALAIPGVMQVGGWLAQTFPNAISGTTGVIGSLASKIGEGWNEVSPGVQGAIALAGAQGALVGGGVLGYKMLAKKKVAKEKKALLREIKGQKGQIERTADIPVGEVIDDKTTNPKQGNTKKTKKNRRLRIAPGTGSAA